MAQWGLELQIQLVLRWVLSSPGQCQSLGSAGSPGTATLEHGRLLGNASLWTRLFPETVSEHSQAMCSRPLGRAVLWHNQSQVTVSKVAPWAQMGPLQTQCSLSGSLRTGGPGHSQPLGTADPQALSLHRHSHSLDGWFLGTLGLWAWSAVTAHRCFWAQLGPWVPKVSLDPRTKWTPDIVHSDSPP